MQLFWRSLGRLSPARTLQQSISSYSRQFHPTTPRAAIEMTTVRTTERLAQLRELMKQNGVDVYSENVREVAWQYRGTNHAYYSCALRRQPSIRIHCTNRCTKRFICSRTQQTPSFHSNTNLAFISGFNGSAGTAVVTHDKAAIATDGRYFNQAGKQLDENWELLKQGLQDVPTWQEWYTRMNGLSRDTC